MSTTGVSFDLARELRAICGEEHVVEKTPKPLRQASKDDTADRSGIPTPQISPAISVSPGSEDEIAAILRLANQHGFSVVPGGGGTEFRAGAARAEVLLHTDRLREIEHYDHADLTVGVGAGMTVAQLNTMVGADRLMFAADPPFAEHATVGGVLAAASHGPMRHGYGSVRDFCIGIRFVSGDGRKAKGGGRVVKNVAGYDLMKLLIGSFGTLAVITSASFKLFPAPRQTRTFIAEFGSWQEALKFRDLILHSPLSPMCLELVSPRARKVMRPEMTGDSWVICVRGSGSDAALTRYRKELGTAVSREVEGERESAVWRAIENFPASSEPELPPLDLLHMFPRFTVTSALADTGGVIDVMSEFDQPGSAGVAIIGRVAVGHVHATLWAEDVDLVTPELEFCEALQNRLPPGCSLTVSGAAKPCVITPNDYASMSGVKQALDPNEVLRGRELF